MSVAKYKPAKKEELLEIKGFGKHKIENYGDFRKYLSFCITKKALVYIIRRRFCI